MYSEESYKNCDSYELYFPIQTISVYSRGGRPKNVQSEYNLKILGQEYFNRNIFKGATELAISRQ